MAAQVTLTHLVMVRIHAGQPSRTAMNRRYSRSGTTTWPPISALSANRQIYESAQIRRLFVRQFVRLKSTGVSPPHRADAALLHRCTRSRLISGPSDQEAPELTAD